MIDWFSRLSEVATIIAAGGVYWAIVQLRHSRRAASAALLTSLNDSVSRHWQDFIAATTDAGRDFHFRQILNTMEAACACYLDRLFACRTGEIMRNYLRAHLRMFNTNDFARDILEQRETVTTYINIQKFIEREKPKGLFTNAHLPVD